MGWISDRHMKRGGSIGGNPMKTRATNQHPLRDIVWVLIWSNNLFAPNHVEFSCGHRGTAWGMKKGRCRECPAR